MILKVFGAFLGVLAFSVLLEVPKKYLLYAGAVGAVGGFVYLFAGEFGANDVFATFLSAFTIAFISHIFARIFKTPVTVFLIPGIVPTVPGGGMYHIGYYLFQKNTELTAYHITNTLQLAGAIAIALFIVDAVFRLFQKGWKQNSMRYEQKDVDK